MKPWNLEPAATGVLIGIVQWFIQILLFHGYRLYKGTLVQQLIQQMTSGELKNFLEKDLSCVNKYKNMLAIVQQKSNCWTGPTDVRPLFDQEEEAAAVRALNDVHLEHTVSLKARHTAKDKKKEKGTEIQ